MGLVVQPPSRSYGGGISNDGTLIFVARTLSSGGGISNDGKMIFVGSTLSGGGINNDGLLSIVTSTLAGGDGITNDGWVTLQNTILAIGDGDCDRPLISLGHNLIGDPSACPIILSQSDLIGPPSIGPFTDNGFPGNGHFPLLPNSPAIHSSDNAACPTTDQLWRPRVGDCDIGAIEFPCAS